jgi:glucosamine 6-phosphate synthetase-like amidotransferase/phosphosugar isomerase protein
LGIRDYIYEQPETLRRIFQEGSGRVRSLLDSLLTDPPRRIFLIGSGTSKNALMALEPMMSRILRVPIAVYGPMAFMNYLSPSCLPGSLAILLSQSGTSTTTIEAALYAKEEGVKTLAITSDPESKFAQNPGEKLIIPMGIEKVGPKTKGYTSTLAALMQLTLSWGAAQGTVVFDPPQMEKLLDSFCEDLKEKLPAWESTAEAQAKAFQRSQQILVLGQGRHAGTALEGSLKISEISGMASSGYDTEEGLHGRFHGLDEKSLVLFLAATSKEEELTRSAAKVVSDLGIGGCIYLLAKDLSLKGEARRKISGFDEFRVSSFSHPLIPELDLIELMIPLQFLALHLALAKGMVPEKMKYPGLSAKLGIKVRTEPKRI